VSELLTVLLVFLCAPVALAVVLWLIVALADCGEDDFGTRFDPPPWW
jgi:hypothetical protein